MKHILLAFALAGLSGLAMAVDAPALPTTRAPGGAKVYIISPGDGASVGQEVTVRFGLKGMGVAPAGVDKENTGHHHLLVDVKTLPAAGQPIPADARHIHFGGGQTQTTLKLAPGTQHVATGTGRSESCAVRSAAGVEEDHRSREVSAAGGTGGAACGRSVKIVNFA